MTRRALLLASLALTACAALPQAPPCGAPGTGPHLWLGDFGWHTEIGLDAALLPAALRQGFDASGLLFLGFGKRHFMLAERPGLPEFLAGLLPGEGAMTVTAWPAPPPGALLLPITPAGLAGLIAALEASFAPGPALIEARPTRRFYAASRGYNLAFTCNTWTAAMLGAAGLPVRTDGVVLARSVMSQVLGAAQVCQAGPVRLSRAA